MTSSRKFLLAALVSAAFICANGLCRADNNLPRNAAPNSNLTSKEPITDVTTRLDRFIQMRVGQLEIPGYSLAIPPSFGNRRMLAMNGGVPGVASSILIFPDEKVAVVALSNLRKKPVHKIARDAAQIYFNQERAVDPGEDDIPDAEPAGVPMEVQ